MPLWAAHSIHAGFDHVKRVHDYDLAHTSHSSCYELVNEGQRLIGRHGGSGAWGGCGGWKGRCGKKLLKNSGRQSVVVGAEIRGSTGLRSGEGRVGLIAGLVESARRWLFLSTFRCRARLREGATRNLRHQPRSNLRPSANHTIHRRPASSCSDGVMHFCECK